ncbi:hypothetical protein B0I35DRAFT_362535 [Stachybotrys elegans]|uniref:RBR-type E3 ubiquitin transferase n=1 Tax=Stachybotrys elegans TaxID=80388 RepID=A0A8K0SJM0_9HYPO|nr:hypothetical protein B0I35DRAFT_362535 [Stachybotrys elegans]
MAESDHSQNASAGAVLESLPVVPQLPELDDVTYIAQVLLVYDQKLESRLQDELEARATELGLSLSRPSTPDARNALSVQSASTVTTDTLHGRRSSTVSRRSTSTLLTNYSSVISPPASNAPQPDAKPRLRPQDSDCLDFSRYDDLVRKLDDKLSQAKIYRASLPATTSTQSLFSVSSRKSRFSIPAGFRNRVRWRKSTLSLQPARLCKQCCQDLTHSSVLHTMPCGHDICANCLRTIVQLAATNEVTMPPRCCSQPMPSTSLRQLLDRAVQEELLQAVELWHTPKSSRIYCPNQNCGALVPSMSSKANLKHPSKLVCHKCQMQICAFCKRYAHTETWVCPDDPELSNLTASGKLDGWRKCFKCRQLVEPTSGSTRMTCRCKAQFCSICGGIWDLAGGCPNLCNNEELEKEKTADGESLPPEPVADETSSTVQAEDLESIQAAETRTAEHPEFQTLRRKQEDEMKRFQQFMREAKERMQHRHTNERKMIGDQYAQVEDMMKEKHAVAVNQLEDRQIAAEMELRTTLDQTERSIKIRLKHMEAYCEGLGKSPDSHLPPRVVTERDLRELGQQYNARDGMEHLHQAKINVMRDRQARRMAELISEQEGELETLRAEQKKDLERLDSQFSLEEATLDTTFWARRWRMNRRWETMIRILCKELVKKDEVEYGFVPPPKWPDDMNSMACVAVKPARQPTHQRRATVPSIELDSITGATP